MKNFRYSDYEDVLIPLISYFALTNQRWRTSNSVASALNLDPKKVYNTLKGFPELFWKSEQKNDGDHFFTLHLRYASIKLDSNGEEKYSRAPLASEYLQTLLNHVTKKVEHESNQQRYKVQNLVTMSGAWIAAIASICAAIIKLG